MQFFKDNDINVLSENTKVKVKHGNKILIGVIMDYPEYGI